MKTRVSYVLFFLVLLFSLMASLSAPVAAQAPITTSTPVNILQVETPVPDANTINFYQMAQEDIQLVGPLDYAPLVFGLPAEWKLTGSAELNLNVGVALNTVTVNTADGQLANFGGLLSLEYNRNNIGTFPLNEKGETTIRVLIPLEYLKPVRADGRQELTFTLDSGISCLINQQMIIAIHTSSSISFPHDFQKPDTSLAQFPFPLFQSSIFPDTALILVPDEPSEAELQSALTISAGLSNLTGTRLIMDLATYGTVTPVQLSSNHVILVGKATSISALSLLELPLPLVDGSFQIEGGNVDDGFVQMTSSPWNEGRIALLVSGNTDAGVLKAAQAISTGVLRQSSLPNLSVVKDINSSDSIPLSQGDRYLSDLGYSTMILQRRGSDSASVRFNIPPGWVAAPDAYFELSFGHSSLIDFNRSGLVIQINNQPVGSVRFTDATAAQTINRLRVTIPATVLVSGTNTIDIISSLQPVDNCSTPNIQGLWVNIWPDSFLHLPLLQSVISIAPVFDLKGFPAPLTFEPTMSDVAFILQRNNVDSWRYGLQIAAYVGDRNNGTISMPQMFYADSIPDSARSSQNLVLVGNALQMPIVQELNNNLPAPFEDATGIATEKNMQVTFRIPSNSPVGYIELLQSPWNQEKVIIAALGNTPQGVQWAASGLYTSNIRSQLAGNFAVINGEQVTTADTRLSPPEADNTSSPDQTNILVVPPIITENLPAPTIQGWILPALIGSLTLMVALIISVIYGSYIRSRTWDNKSLLGEESKTDGDE